MRRAEAAMTNHHYNPEGIDPPDFICNIKDRKTSNL